MYDADARQEALEPPAIKLNGTVHTGRCLSFDDGAALREDFETLRGGGIDEGFVKALTVKVFRVLGFEDPVALELLRTKSFGVVVGTLSDFSGALLGVRVKADGAPTPTPRPSSDSAE